MEQISEVISRLYTERDRITAAIAALEPLVKNGAANGIGDGHSTNGAKPQTERIRTVLRNHGPMTIDEVASALRIRSAHGRKNLGINLALTASAGRGVRRIGRGVYAIDE